MIRNAGAAPAFVIVYAPAADEALRLVADRAGQTGRFVPEMTPACRVMPGKPDL